ncbi:DUF2271 domain-containing protein [Croceicoccus sp. F390]|uniref:DUF2271 domain-containing protein n=1 Tax=Croceicoccus esteveae TaxID=3075597 RepID=A0ABU2ZDQ5_9SPHN|nr:DUF2271 domain-containing protein [Croceicoccus sp. F390]MDT0574732.1 DUF2271 domain-containing protein [Croceicoccus sp. F390]
MKKILALAAAGMLAVPAHAEELEVALEIPRLRIAEYHRPYVAMWVETESGKTAATLNVWYDTDAKGEDGRKWLPDLRTWWRRAGRAMTMPADGISGPTRAPGQYRVRHASGSKPLSALAPGNYRLQVEAAREVGGRELVTIPFQWPPRRAATASARGTTELGTVRLITRP